MSIITKTINTFEEYVNETFQDISQDKLLNYQEDCHLYRFI